MLIPLNTLCLRRGHGPQQSTLHLDVQYATGRAHHGNGPRAYLRALESHVDGQPGAEPGQGLEVGGAGQGASTLGEDREGQGLEVLGVEVPLAAAHRLQQVLAWNDLEARRRGTTFFSGVGDTWHGFKQ